jgi:hypothetical protein
MFYLFLVKIVIAAEIIRNMSKKGRHWDDVRNWLVVDWSEVWGAGRRCARNTIFSWANFVQAAAEGMWRKPVFRYPGLRSENWVIPVPMWLDI